jgi:hypothetical protein
MTTKRPRKRKLTHLEAALARAKTRERLQRHRQNASQQETDERRAEDRNRYRERRDNETNDETNQRQERERNRQRDRRDNETNDETNQRQEGARNRQRERRDNETNDETNQRQEGDRNRHRERRDQAMRDVQQQQQHAALPPPPQSVPAFKTIMANIVATKGNIDPALLDVTGHPQTRELQREFTRKMNDYADSLNYCPTCKERYFGKTFSLTSPNACKKCDMLRQGLLLSHSYLLR